MGRSILMWCSGLVSLALLVTLAIGQAEKPKPIVTVTKADQSTLRGRLLEYDADKLKLEIGPKPGEGEVVDVPWAEIAKVSNGLTYAKALEEWKTANAGKLCDTCHGNRTVKCADCHGTGHEHAASKDCTKCKGEGEIKCAQPRCKEGKVPCPGKCLKLSEGTWVKKDDGKRWRTIKFGTQSLNISEGHAGEVWESENGQGVNRGKCPTCAGTTEVTCPKCEGTSTNPCPTCLATKDAPDCPTCTAGRSECATCKGSGLKPQ